LLTASVDNSARIWSLPDGRLAIPPLQHPRTVERAVFSPDGAVVATASLDRTARIWDARTGQALTPPLRHAYPLDRVDFTSDGKRLVTVTWKGVARYWDTKTGRPLSEWLNAGGYWATCFDRASDRIAVGTTQGLMSIWGVPRASTPVPNWFPAFAEAVAGLRLAESGSMELVPNHVLKDFVHNAAVQAADNDYAQMARWFLQTPLADPAGEPR
jgi:WD40 repeat protein